MFGFTPREKAYIAPFLLFLGLLAVGELVGKVGDGFAHWVFSAPRYWIYPLQTVCCGALLLHYRQYYQLSRPRSVFFASFIGIIVLGIWILPQVLGIQLFGWGAPRTDGFDPAIFGGGAPYYFNVAMRFVRLVVVVPFVEEIFWRGFLLRYVIRHDFESVPFGSFTWTSFLVVTVGFCMEHQVVDWPAAIVAGALYNLVAYRTRSLTACVLAHAITNFLLGCYILTYGQYGFW
jgi:CAAX prenyl protease-like protein